MDKHEYVEHRTYTGPGCAMCGGSREQHDQVGTRVRVIMHYDGRKFCYNVDVWVEGVGLVWAGSRSLHRDAIAIAVEWLDSSEYKSLPRQV
jgi:hypothetical protein